MSDDARFLRCRTFNHRWGVFDPASVPGAVPTVTGHVVLPGINEWVLLCDSCGTWRFDYIRQSGTVLRRKYIYPDGYLRAKGEEKLHRADYRLQVLSAGMQSLLRSVLS